MAADPRESSEALVNALGCQRCQRRPRGSTAWVLQPCNACRRVMGEEVGSSSLLTQIERFGWSVTLAELTGYLTTKVPSAPWAVLEWSGDLAPPAFLRAFQEVQARTPSFRRGDGTPTLFDQSFFVPTWLSLLLDAGTFVRKLSGIPNAMRPRWPEVLQRALVDIEARQALTTCMQAASTALPPPGVKQAPVEDSDGTKQTPAGNIVGERMLTLVREHFPDTIGIVQKPRRRL